MSRCCINYVFRSKSCLLMWEYKLLFLLQVDWVFDLHVGPKAAGAAPEGTRAMHGLGDIVELGAWLVIEARSSC